MEAEHALLLRALTVVLNLSFAVLVGASAAGLWLRARRSPWAQGLAARLQVALQLGAGAALAASCAILWTEAASMAEVPLAEAWPAVRSVLAATHYGFAWTIGAAALLALGAGCVIKPRFQAGGAAWTLRIAALAVLLYSRSMVSHAGAAGSLTAAVAADWLHLVLVSLWVGEVLVAGLLVLRRLPDDAATGRADCARYVQALSRSATVALAGIVATGAWAAWRVLGSPSDLAGSPYGAALLVKLGLVVGAVALGGVNRFCVMPALLRSLHRPAQPGPKAGRRFVRILQAEAVVLLAVVVAAAVLASTPPPMASE